MEPGTPPVEGNDALRPFQWLTNGVLLIHPERGIIYANLAAETLLGLALSALRGHRLEEIVIPSPELIAGLQRVWRDAWSPTRTMIETRERPGRPSVLLACDLQLLEGVPTCVLAELHNVDTSLRSVREEAQNTWQQSSMALVRNLAHEIRNPLGGMRGAAQLLQTLLPSEELREYTHVILTEVDRLHRLMDQFLLPSPQGPMSKHNIHHLTEQVVRLVAQEYPKLKLTRDYDPSLPEVECHGDLLVQCLLNIVRNAAQAVNGRGKVVVRTRVSHRATLGKRSYPHVLQIQVDDDGQGIDEAILEKIFQPLFSLKSSGTGLGLTVARQAANMHGGTISAQCSPGLTRFSILIPFEQR